MANTLDSPQSISEDAADWDRSSHKEFYEYYAKESQSPASLGRFRRQRDAILGVAHQAKLPDTLDVLDIGSGAGTLAMLWAEVGHRVVGIDINEPLIQLARRRAQESRLDVRFEVGSATELPLPSESFDICFAPELLEHVADWQSCLDEFARVLRGGGLLFLSTTNSLCPLQQEFNLPFYSWYPGPLKRHFERLAVTSRPEIANHAKYPAVNWFTTYELTNALTSRGFVHVMDRFDIAAAKDRGGLKCLTLKTIRALPPFRWLAHVAAEDTLLIGIKARGD
jgi:2-polyprenyl-6-hydroxyphenyl methylase/3-demethylubiquinone-9 3-methyltransferase